MDDFNQIEVPPSFQTLFTSPSGHRLTAPMSQVRDRYELCEDLAQALTEQASMALHKSGAGQAEVLEAVRTGLAAQGTVEPAEAGWIGHRLAELLGWTPPSGSH
jgi:hypothetical protein